MTLQAAHTATEREARDAGVPDHAHGADEAVGLGRGVERAEERAPADARRAPLRIHNHVLHRRQVDDQSPVGADDPGDAVAAGPHRDDEVSFPGERDRGRDVHAARRSEDHRGAAVEHGVPQAPRLVVGRVGGRDDRALERPAQLRSIVRSHRAIIAPRSCIGCAPPGVR